MLKQEIAMLIDAEKLIGKEVVVGFGADKNRLVVEFSDGGGFTFFATKETIEIAEREAITLKITPPWVVCEDCSLIFPYQIVMKLGRHRFLTAISRAEGDLFVAYLPDKQDIETCSSEFLNQI